MLTSIFCLVSQLGYSPPLPSAASPPPSESSATVSIVEAVPTPPSLSSPTSPSNLSILQFRFCPVTIQSLKQKDAAPILWPVDTPTILPSSRRQWIFQQSNANSSQSSESSLSQCWQIYPQRVLNLPKLHKVQWFGHAIAAMRNRVEPVFVCSLNCMSLTHIDLRKSHGILKRWLLYAYAATAADPSHCSSQESSTHSTYLYIYVSWGDQRRLELNAKSICCPLKHMPIHWHELPHESADHMLYMDISLPSGHSKLPISGSPLSSHIIFIDSITDLQHFPPFHPCRLPHCWMSDAPVKPSLHATVHAQFSRQVKHSSPTYTIWDCCLHSSVVVWFLCYLTTQCNNMLYALDVHIWE